MDTKNFNIKEHDVFVHTPSDKAVIRTRKIMRRVVAVRDGMVCYSNGTDQNQFCQLQTFMRWIKRKTVTQVYKAKTSHERDPMQYGGGDCCDGEHP